MTKFAPVCAGHSFGSSRVVRRCLRARVAPLPLAAALACVGAAQAQSPAASTAVSGEAAQTISITGSRVSTRVLTETSTPVDLVRREDLVNTGQTQLQNALSIVVPSFSVSKPSTAGALDFTSSPTLRGLGPGDTLLLVNGKRRHSMPALNLNNQIGRGDVGYDFNTLPPMAIGRVEVLRDGASAIYGADAVAGVINVVLDKSLGGVGSVQFGATGEGDGQTTEASAGFGIRIGEKGVLRTTVRLNERKRSNRAEPDTRQQYFGTNPTTGALTTISGSGTGLTRSGSTPILQAAATRPAPAGISFTPRSGNCCSASTPTTCAGVPGWLACSSSVCWRGRCGRRVGRRIWP